MVAIVLVRSSSENWCQCSNSFVVVRIKDIGVWIPLLIVVETPAIDEDDRTFGQLISINPVY